MKINAINNNQPSFGMAAQLNRPMRNTLKSLEKVQNVQGVYDILNYLNNKLTGYDFRFLRRDALFGKGVLVDIFTPAKTNAYGTILEEARNIGSIPTTIRQMTKNPRSIIGRIGSVIELRRYNDEHIPSRFFENMKDFVDKSFGDVPVFNSNKRRPSGSRTFRY